MVTNVLNWVAAECQGIYLYESESWMNPSLECGDVLYWDSQYSMGTKQAKIIRQEFRFNGTLSGTMNGKGLGASFTRVPPDSTGGSLTSGCDGSDSPNEAIVDYNTLAIQTNPLVITFPAPFATQPTLLGTVYGALTNFTFMFARTSPDGTQTVNVALDSGTPGWMYTGATIQFPDSTYIGLHFGFLVVGI